MKFITNEKGKKIAAVIPIREYEDLLQDIQSAVTIGRRLNEKSYPWEDLKKQRIADDIVSS